MSIRGISRRLWTNIHQSFFVVAMMVGVIIGAILAIVFRINYFALPIWLVLAMLLLIIVYFKPKLVLIILAIISGMIVVFYRVSDELAKENYIRKLYDSNVTVVGIIKDDPKSDEEATKFKLSIIEIKDEETGGSLYISLSKNEEIQRGDELTLTGKMMSGFGTYAGYMFKPKILSIRRPEPGDLTVRVRNWFAGRIKNVMGEEAGLGLSYLMGIRNGLDDDLNEKLKTVGLVHIVVASGAHLAILVGIARKIFGRLSRFAGLLFAVLLVVLFMTMIGYTPSIMRAGIMSILNLITWYVGRKMEPWRIILIVAGITLMINPMFLIDLGWLLSFASFIGIMIIGPTLTKYFYGERKPNAVASMIITTISATLMTLPITLYFYGTVSLISVIANLLILPTLPWAMGLTFLSGICASITGVSEIVSWCAMRMIDFHTKVVDFFSGMEQFLVKIPTYKWQVFLIYIVVAVVIGLIWRKMVKLRKVDIKFDRS